MSDDDDDDNNGNGLPMLTGDNAGGDRSTAEALVIRLRPECEEIYWAEEQTLTLVLNSLKSAHSRRAYARALRSFFRWWRRSNHTELNKLAVQDYITTLRTATKPVKVRKTAAAKESGRKRTRKKPVPVKSVPRFTPSTINQQLAAIRKLAREAADNKLIPEDLLAGILRIKGDQKLTSAVGNWLTLKEAQLWIDQPDTTQMKGLRDSAILATMIGCGLRRAEAATLEFNSIQKRDDRWVLLNILGKGAKRRTVPIPAFTMEALDRWVLAAEIEDGHVFRRVHKSGTVSSEHVSPQTIYDVILYYAKKLKHKKSMSPHDLRRTFAKLAHKGGASIEQIQLSLGHLSIKTTEIYLGLEQNLVDAPGDHINLHITKKERAAAN